MKCREVRRRLSAYLDGELPQGARNELFDHLTECGPCSNLIGELMFTETMVGTLIKRPMQAPVAVRQNVLSAISREAARPVRAPAPLRPRLAWRPAAGFAFAVALAFGVRTVTLSPAPVVEEPVTIASNPTVTATPPEVSAPTQPTQAVRPTTRPTRVAVKSPAIRPAPPRVQSTTPPLKPTIAPERVATPEVPVSPRTTETLAVGFVSWMEGSSQEKVGNGQWEDFSSDNPVKVSARFRNAENTVVSMELNDGTVVKSNSSTEFIVLRSPTRDDPYWVVHLVRGELFVRSVGAVRVVTNAARADLNTGEFSIRSVASDDIAVVTLTGDARLANDYGTVLLKADEGASASEGVAPGAAFYVDAARMTEWAFLPTQPMDPLDTGGTQS